MPNALILGANTPVGAYLARLLHARGSAVFGIADASTSDALTALGITDSVNAVPAADAARLAGELPDATIFAINQGDPGQAALISQALAAARPDARIAHIADAETLRRDPALRDQVTAIAASRREGGRRAVNAILHAHDSRLGSADTLPARIVAAAFRAGNGAAPAEPLSLTETGPRDWGWTAEYVDAIARLAALDRPLDLAIGSGRTLDVGAFVEHAFGFFKASPAGHVIVTPAATAAEPPVDTARLHAATGWRALTHGRDLVHALCEGAAGRFAT